MFRLRSMHDSAIPHKSTYTERNSKGRDLLRDQESTILSHQENHAGESDTLLTTTTLLA